MKLLIVTSVEEYSKDVYKLFKHSGISSFSGSQIEGFKNVPTLLKTSSWFPSEQGGTESSLYFSFEREEKIKELIKRIKEYNNNLDSDNPIRAIVIPIESYI
ncbi:MAG: hypothetical protein KJO49_07160 [Bacteroidia bacterium]|nr:hypothetical protein [Bacteroidia bacterium]MBT8269872.1 hypothetical protein [Bacteroidia bacterium]NNK71372.1 hypothetical protein [Flavobacteriaceae bacterium]NNL80707.1 hypothetical protein [Flavobacteriaceae bacterium]